MTPRSSSSDDFEITLPTEARYERRVQIGHTASQWKFRLREYNHRCAYCGRHQRATPEQHLFRDHVQAVSRGGTDEIDNVVPACWQCNGRKRDWHPGEITADGWQVPAPRIYTRARRT